MTSNTPETQAILPVTAEDEKRADDWATMIGRMGGVFLDQSQRRGLASQFAAHRLEASGAVTASNADLERLVENNQANPDAIALATRHRISHSLPGDVGMRAEDVMVAFANHLLDYRQNHLRPDEEHLKAGISRAISLTADPLFPAALTPSALSGDNSQSSSNAGGVDDLEAIAKEICDAVYPHHVITEPISEPTRRMEQTLGAKFAPTAEPMEMLVDQTWLDRRQDEPDAHVEAGYFSHPHIAEPARRIIERVADAVTTMQRESTAAGHEMAETIARECIPHFEKLGMSNEGDGWGFDEDLFGHDDLDRLFRLRWDADQRATKRWQAGDELAHCGELRPLLDEVLSFLREAEDGAASALAERLSAELEEAKPGNRDAIWPDHADMVVWLLGELDHLTALSATPAQEGEAFSKDWCVNMARKEAGYEIGAGMVAIDPTFPEQEKTDDQ